MSFIGSMFNNSQGAGWSAASDPNLQLPTTNQQAQQQYGNAQTGLAQQQSFLQALQGQNGIQNQSNVYNQLQGVANGTGPNPAQAALNQNTGQNVANQAALMAGQRGAGSNVGLMARQAAQQGAATQQQAVGQGATMQANQSLNALNSMGSLANTQVANQAGATNAYSSSAQGEQSNILNAIQGQNASTVGLQNGVNSANASIAAINAGGQQGLLGGVLGGVGSALNLAKGGQVPHYAVGGGVNTGNFGINNSDPNSMSNDQSNALDQMDGSNKNPNQPGAPKSSAGQYFKSGQMGKNQGSGTNLGGLLGSAIGHGVSAIIGSNKPSGPQGAPNSNVNASADNLKSNVLAAPDAAPESNPMSINADNSMPMTASHGGKVPAMVSPGEKYLNPKEAKAVKEGKADIKKVGEVIKGKAPVKGDSLKNDIVPKTLEAGGIVIPRSHMKDMKSAINFVHAHMSRELAMKKGK